MKRLFLYTLLVLLSAIQTQAIPKDSISKQLNDSSSTSEALPQKGKKNVKDAELSSVGSGDISLWNIFSVIALLASIGAVVLSIVNKKKCDAFFYDILDKMKKMEDGNIKSEANLKSTLSSIKQELVSDCKDLINTRLENRNVSAARPSGGVNGNEEILSELKPVEVFNKIVKYATFSKNLSCFNEDMFSDDPEYMTFKITIESPTESLYEVVNNVQDNSNLMNIVPAVKCKGYDNWRECSSIVSVSPGHLVKASPSDSMWVIKDKAIVDLIK